MWQRFTERARKVVFYAQVESQRLGDIEVSTEHILLGLTREDDSVAARVLTTLGLSLDRIREEVEKLVPASVATPSVDMTLTEAVKQSINCAYEESKALENNYIGTEHLLLGLMRSEESIAARVLATLGANLEAARAEVVKLQNREATGQ